MDTLKTTKKEKEKSEMIKKIILKLKNDCIVNNKPFDGANVFFDLAFMDNKNLRKICNKF